VITAEPSKKIRCN